MPEPKLALALTPVSLRVEESGNQRTVTSLIEVRNGSATPFRELVIEVRYFDTEGKLVDSVTDAPFRLVAPPGDTITVRVMDRASRPAAAYVRQEVRLLDAEPVPRQGSTEKGPVWVNLLVSWGPLLLLVGVWIWLASRKSSPNQRLVALMEQQMQLMGEQNHSLARIANAMDRRES